MNTGQFTTNVERRTENNLSTTCVIDWCIIRYIALIICSKNNRTIQIGYLYFVDICGYYLFDR